MLVRTWMVCVVVMAGLTLLPGSAQAQDAPCGYVDAYSDIEQGYAYEQSVSCAVDTGVAGDATARCGNWWWQTNGNDGADFTGCEASAAGMEVRCGDGRRYAQFVSTSTVGCTGPIYAACADTQSGGQGFGRELVCEVEPVDGSGVRCTDYYRYDEPEQTTPVAHRECTVTATGETVVSQPLPTEPVLPLLW